MDSISRYEWNQGDWEKDQYGILVRRATLGRVDKRNLPNNLQMTANGHLLFPPPPEILYECKECTCWGPTNICPSCKKPRPLKQIIYFCPTCSCEGISPECSICKKPRPIKGARGVVPKWAENYISDECKGVDKHHKCGNYHCKCECHDVDLGQETPKPEMNLNDEHLAFYCDSAIRSGDPQQHFKCSGLYCRCACHVASRNSLPLRYIGEKCNKKHPKHSECDDTHCTCVCHDVSGDQELIEIVEDNSVSEKCTWVVKGHDEWLCSTHNSFYAGIKLPGICPVRKGKLEYKSDRCRTKIEFSPGGFPTSSWFVIESHKRCSDYKCKCECHESSNMMIQPMMNDHTRWQCPGCKAWIEESIHKECYQCRQKKLGNPQNDSKPENEGFIKCSTCSLQYNPKYVRGHTCLGDNSKPTSEKDQVVENEELTHQVQLEDGEIYHLSEQERDELYWATSLNYYPNKNPKKKSTRPPNLNGSLFCVFCDFNNSHNRTVTNCPDCDGFPKLVAYPTEILECPAYECDYDNREDRRITNCPKCQHAPALTKGYNINDQPKALPPAVILNGKGEVDLMKIVKHNLRITDADLIETGESSYHEEDDILSKRIRKLRKDNQEREIKLPEIELNPS